MVFLPSPRSGTPPGETFSASTAPSLALAVPMLGHLLSCPLWQEPAGDLVDVDAAGAAGPAEVSLSL